ncbi:MAG: amidohydrolase family protein [Candidatus Cloacimonetes bacterium]|nr:amidohydrolase family protein [Candidatus Cloacimonadota bacterium]
MKITVDTVIYHSELAEKDTTIEIKSSLLNDTVSSIILKKCFAYKPFINSHDHLIGNWYPPARDNDLYPNAQIWVNEMRDSSSVKERDKIFMNALPMNFMHGRGRLLAQLGAYKNLLSGVSTVQDHAPRQKNSYYSLFPIKVIKNYRQCHSLSLGNFWGDDDPVKEWKATKGKEPFIVHLGEGLDKETGKEFELLKELGLLQPNTLLIHGISLTEKEIKECAETGTSICWCAFSNLNLIGKTLNIDACLKHGVNVTIGTDSTLSGSINLLHEIQYSYNKYPHIEPKTYYKMITENAAKALLLPSDFSHLSNKAKNSILLIKAKDADPFDNLMRVNYHDILLLLYEGLPIYGSRELLNHFDINDEDYYFFSNNQEERFVIGHPEKIMDEINHILGYKKELPYLPFQK